jgi:hypothetical protein
MGSPYCELTDSCFAEFLHEESLVRLGLLALSTCVGLRYGFNIPIIEVFLERLLIEIDFALTKSFRIP